MRLTEKLASITVPTKIEVDGRTVTIVPVGYAVDGDRLIPVVQILEDSAEEAPRTVALRAGDGEREDWLDTTEKEH